MRASSLWVSLALTAVSVAPGQQVASGVEPHVLEAFDAALQRLPPAWRRELGDVTLCRVRSLGVPSDAPLSARLMGRATLAYFSNVKRRICVTDAGARARPSWGGAPPAAEHVATFLLDELGYDAVGTREQRVDGAWRRFVTTVHRWRGQPAPEPLPALGAVAVLDRFLVDGVRRALGGDVPLEQVLFHELAHAVQNHLRRMQAHMTMWGSLSGWRERDPDREADGYSGGMFAMERPAVLIRLLLGLPRGDAIYAPHEHARFVNTYARFDLREDFAECARLMAYQPDALAAAAPAKFLYLDALGWSARLDGRHPGPLWMPSGRLPASVVAAGARALLHEDPDGIRPHPLAVAAVLRAHRAVLEQADLPAAHAAKGAPSDLPPELAARLGSGAFTFVVAGEERQPARSRLLEVYDQELCRWVDHRVMAEEFERVLAWTRAELLASIERDVVGAPDPFERQHRFDRKVPQLRQELSDREFRALCAREARFHRAAGGAGGGDELTAMRYELMATGAPAPSSAKVLAAPPPTYGGIELLVVRARTLVRAGDRAAAKAVVARIPGHTWGALRRVQLQLELGDDAAALATAAAVSLPGLRDLARGHVADWLDANGRPDEARRVRGLRGRAGPR